MTDNLLCLYNSKHVHYISISAGQVNSEWQETVPNDDYLYVKMQAIRFWQSANYIVYVMENTYFVKLRIRFEDPDDFTFNRREEEEFIRKDQIGFEEESV